MSRKDYEKIARILRNSPLAPNVRADLAHEIAAVCAADNPRFSVEKFLLAATGEN